jgi:NAD-dependent SIR2 family protein deacetylase
MADMAQKDLGKGFGELRGSLKEWRCPKCDKNYPVEDWAIVHNGSFDGRKCPQCDFTAHQVNETLAMIPK